MISLICPVYKAESYLRRCVDSVLAQTYHEWELILVDDGSPDQSGAICDEYADKDERIQVIHQENGGVTSARKAGVKKAQGEWICFVDADDTIPNDAIQSLYSCSTGVDIVYGCIYSVFSDLKVAYIPIEDYRNMLIRHSGVNVGPYGKLLRRTLFTNNIFEIPKEINLGEDLIMNLRLSFNTNKDVNICNKIVYNYINNSESVTHKYIRTLEYNKKYYPVLLNSIPKDVTRHYRRSLVNIRIVWFLNAKIETPSFNCHTDSFYKDLLVDMQNCNIKMPILNQLFLKSNTLVIMKLLIRLSNLFRMNLYNIT